ncbi:HD domain-containing protein [Agarilytica rhodophyticola]|uniref:HD domain-containing protein n=1 Tax=Agarilytica rhodophyticola TaxID=1737490 RepID=UPI000B3455F1|nr:HD domain-containing protein [Agarilytica rhodophyticola]
MITLAREFAIQRHGSQKYGEHPYINHLEAVADIATPYGDTAIIIAYLHDVVEDTDTSLEEIETRFGIFIANCVAILTDEPGDSRKERKAKTYKKMREVSGDLEMALIVKAADRLSNVRACVADKNTRLLDIYKDEHKVFKKSVYRPDLCEPIWRDIEANIHCEIT